MYSLVIGVSAAVLLAILIVAMKVSDLTQGVYVRDGEEYRAEVLSRIAPVGEVYLSGEQIGETAPTIMVDPDPEPVATMMTGPQTYNTACNACHGTGAGGAPVLGDATAWADRMTQGVDVMKEHAIKGFHGATGFMPAKGGNPTLTDGEVADAVDYMIGELQ